MKTPRVKGAALEALASAVQSGPVRRLAAELSRRDLGVPQMRALPALERGPLQMDARPTQARSEHARASQELGLPRSDGAWPRSSEALGHALRSGVVTPVELTRRAFELAKKLAAERCGPLLDTDEASALRDAEASTERHRAGAPLGPLDGIPVTIKEEVCVRGLPARVGLGALPPTPSAEDAVFVARLRRAGAIVLGTTPMTEYGLSPMGISPQRALPRNPHDVRHAAGGSSTGAGVSVATGLVPMAHGADGGGSIRTPAAMVGVFGLKPTFGRIPRTGGLFGGTMDHYGPLAASAADLARFLEATGGEDRGDPLTRDVHAWLPRALDEALGRGVRGLRIGVLEDAFASADPDIGRAGLDALRALQKEGAILVPRRIPLFAHTNAIGSLSIAIEAYCATLSLRREHEARLGPQFRIELAVLSESRGDEYVDAQMLRATLRAQTAEVLREVDVLALPTVACTAPRVSDEEMRGFLDPPLLEQHLRYAFPANLTGLPAGTAPIGKDRGGMPIGLQLMGDAWDEACVLQVLAHLERAGVARAERPRVSVDLLA